MSISPISSLAATKSQESSSGSLPQTSELSRDAFLQLLVAQLKNQDPLNPADGMQFVTQLAQFSELEQVIAIREDLDAAVAGANPVAGQQQ